MEGEQPPIDLELLTTDAELVRRAQTGTPEQREQALEQLSKRYLQVAFKSAVVTLRDDDAARDAAQETMVQLLLHIGRLDATREVRSWVATVARNKAADIRRFMRRIVQFSCDGDEHEREDGRTPFEQMLYRDVMRAIDALPPKLRVVAVRHLLDGDSVADIAADLQLTEAAIYARLKAAKHELRKITTWKR